METFIKIIITDNKIQWRNAISASLEDYNIKVLAEANHGAELLEQLQSFKPDVILLDLDMPVMNGNETMNRLSLQYPHIHVIIMSFHDDRILMEDYRMRGAKGFISKDDIAVNIEDLVAGIVKVHNGGRCFNYTTDEKAIKLSVRQKQIIHLVSHGKTKKEIEEELNLSPEGLYSQKKKIMKKAGVNNIESLFQFIFSKSLHFIGKYRNFKSPNSKK